MSSFIINRGCMLFINLFLTIGLVSVILIIDGKLKKRSIKSPVISLVITSMLLLTFIRIINLNPWFILFGHLLFAYIFLIGVIVSVILIIRGKLKKESIRSSVIFLVSINLLLGMFILFDASHPTCYKYNDWLVLGSNIRTVQKRYGDFDRGEVTDNKAGCVAYYLYTDNGPIMPDYLPHYYYMRYDETGKIYEVYESVPPGA